MEIKNKWVSVILVLAMVAGIVYYGMGSDLNSSVSENEKSNIINIWYADEQLTDYIESAAIAYQEDYKVKVVTTLVSGLEYAENINDATLHTDAGPDMYVITNDSLEKVVCAGLATKVTGQDVLNTQNFSQTALDAVTYNNAYVAYPLSFETGFLLYNKTLLEQMAQNAIQTERDSAAGEEAMDEIEKSSEKPEADDVAPASAQTAENEPITEEEITERAEGMVPKSVVGILDVAENYDLPEGVETVFKWDISDVFYNYLFAGAYMNVGSKTGDDRNNIDIYNENTMYCLGIYQDMNQFFSIEAKEVSYEEIMQEFIQQKILFTIATTDCLKVLKDAKQEGTWNAEYGIVPLKKVNETLNTGSLSITNCIAVNGYSQNQDNANEFAKFLSCEYSKNLYARSGKMPSHYQESYSMPCMQEIMDCYASSVSLPKFIETANYWILAEMCYTNIWNGEDVNRSLKNLAQTIESQVYGKQVEKEDLLTPEVVENYNRET